jgi:hypothetical protein
MRISEISLWPESFRIKIRAEMPNLEKLSDVPLPS